MYITRDCNYTSDDGMSLKRQYNKISHTPRLLPSLP